MWLMWPSVEKVCPPLAYQIIPILYNKPGISLPLFNRIRQVAPMRPPSSILLGPMSLPYPKNGISVSSEIFAGLTVMTSRQTDRQRRTDGQADGRTDGRTDGQTDRWSRCVGARVATVSILCLLCSDTVGWASGRAFGL